MNDTKKLSDDAERVRMIWKHYEDEDVEEEDDTDEGEEGDEDEEEDEEDEKDEKDEEDTGDEEDDRDEEDEEDDEDEEEKIFSALNMNSPFEIPVHARISLNYIAKNMLKNLIMYTKSIEIKYINEIRNETMITSLAHLRTFGWVKLPVILSDNSVNCLIKTSSDMSQIYDAILKKNKRHIRGIKSIDDIINKKKDIIKNVKYRDGRLDVMIPFILQMFSDRNKHRWLDVVHAYLENLVQEQITHIKYRDLYDRMKKKDIPYELKTNRFACDNMHNRKAKCLSSSTMDALPECNTQEWHSDPYDITRDPSVLTVFIALDNVVEKNGPTEIISMNQKHLALKNPSYAFIPTNPIKYANKYRIRKEVMTMERGQILLFDPRCVHRGTSNKTKQRRKMCQMIYGIGSMDEHGKYNYTTQVQQQGYFNGIDILPGFYFPSHVRNATK